MKILLKLVYRQWAAGLKRKAAITPPAVLQACSEKPDPEPGTALPYKAPESSGFYCKKRLIFTHI